MQIAFPLLSFYRRYRTPIHLICESLCAVAALFLVYALGLSDEIFFKNISPYIYIFACHLGTVYLAKLHKVSIQYYDSRVTIRRLLIAALLTSFVCFLMVTSAQEVHISIIVIYAFFIISVSLTFHQILKEILHFCLTKNFKSCVVVGDSVNFMINSPLRVSGENYSVIAFFESSKHSVGSIRNGIKIFDKNELQQYLTKNLVDLIIISDAHLDSQNVLSITKAAHILGIPIKVLEADLETKLVSDATFKDFKVEDVLGRVEVSLNSNALVPTFKGRSVLVTGAGGSIGSELCRQLVKLEPSHLVLLEHSEHALYRTELALQSIIRKDNTVIASYLGSVTDALLLDQIMSDHTVEIVLHAAAYKHVHIVEKNVGVAIYNNAIGSKILVDACYRNNIEHALLVSTDKAVRPTNIMGASKRLAELIFLKAKKGDSRCNFSAVRFGNVLGSSGSVIPRFQEQIKSGGPVTLTHLDVTRYFMTTDEAVSLILHSLVIAEHGDLFLLDMGSPVKIRDLAESMIFLAGKTPVYENEYVSKDTYKDSEILVNIVGLAKGEKLYEELLINYEASQTVYPKIFKANEVSLPTNVIEKVFVELLKMKEKNDYTDLPNAFSQLDVQYTPVKNDSLNEQLSSVTTEMEALSDKSHEVHAVKGIKIRSRKEQVREKDSFSFKAISYLLHKYFLISRGMTLGARAVIFLPDRKVVLVKHSYQSGWSLPGGGVEIGEHTLLALKREIKQETGIILPGEPDFFSLYYNKKISKRDHVVLFISHVKSEFGTFKPTAEISDCKAFSVDDLPSDIDTATHRRLREILEGHQVSTTW